MAQSKAFREKLFRRFDEMNKGNENRLRGMSKVQPNDWVLMEKVHGSNFSIYCVEDEKTGKTSIQYGKRNAIIGPNEDFFGFQCLIPKFTEQGTQIKKLLKEKHKLDHCHCVLIYGELFGGKYDHPDVAKSTQTYNLGVERNLPIFTPQLDDFPQYHPDLHFFAFDLKYQVREDGEWIHCSYDEMCGYFDQVKDFLYAKPLVRGELDKVVAFDYEKFETMLPSLLGLGDYPMKGNFAEGIILRHAQHATPGFTPVRGVAEEFQPNTIIKIKGARFQEIKQRSHLAPFEDPLKNLKEEIQKQKGLGEQLLGPLAIFSKEEHEAWETLERHITINRMKNVLSKLGPDPFLYGEETPQTLAMLVAKDALKDFIKDECNPTWLNMPLLKREFMCKHCIRVSQLLITSQWPMLVDSFTSSK